MNHYIPSSIQRFKQKRNRAINGRIRNISGTLPSALIGMQDTIEVKAENRFTAG